MIVLLFILAITCASFGLANSVGLKFKPQLPATMSLAAGLVPPLFLILSLTGGLQKFPETFVRILLYAPILLNLLAGICFSLWKPSHRRRSVTLLYCVSGILVPWVFGAVFYFLLAMAHR